MDPGKVRGEIRKKIKVFLLNEKKRSHLNKQEQATEGKINAVFVMIVKKGMWLE